MHPSRISIIGTALLLALMAVPAAANLTFSTSGPDTIAQGDSVILTGTGAFNGTVSLTVLGRNYYNTFLADPDENGIFSLTLTPEETRKFSSGQYAFVVQDPGANGKPDTGTRITEAGNIFLTGRDIAVADLGQVSGLKADVRPEAERLIRVSERAGSDDLFTLAFFFVELPAIHFDETTDPVTHRILPGRVSHEGLSFSGTTNIGNENRLSARVYKAGTRELVFSRELPVIGTRPESNDPTGGKELNTWTFVMDPSSLGPGEYFLTVGRQNEEISGTGTMFMVIWDSRHGPGSIP